MAKRVPLVCQHLENISRDALARHRLTIYFALLLVLVLVNSGCPGSSSINKARIVVPIRPCLVKGSEWTRAPDPGPNHFPPPPWEGGYFYSEGTDEMDAKVRDLVRRANFEVWIPGAEIAFQPLLSGNNHFPVIDDPKPPGPESEPLRFGPGKFGDIEVHEGEGPTDEMRYAQASCDWAWRRSGIKSNALVVIIARNLVARSGVAPSVGVHPGHLSVRNRNDGRDLCEVPRKLTKEDIRDGYAIIVDPEILSGGSREGPPRGGQGDPAIILAHELGHALLLAHGDGLDNDGNGTQPPASGFRRFDQDCDSTEIQQESSLMSEGGYEKRLTPLQVELARTAAVLAPEALGGPP